MQKITFKGFVNSHRKTNRIRKSLAFKLKSSELKVKTSENSDGGDYWITSTNTIYNVKPYGLKYTSSGYH